MLQRVSDFRFQKSHWDSGPKLFPDNPGLRLILSRRGAPPCPGQRTQSLPPKECGYAPCPRACLQTSRLIFWWLQNTKSSLEMTETPLCNLCKSLVCNTNSSLSVHMNNAVNEINGNLWEILSLWPWEPGFEWKQIRKRRTRLWLRSPLWSQDQEG